jgi:hypothetical protein
MLADISALVECVASVRVDPQAVPGCGGKTACCTNPVQPETTQKPGDGSKCNCTAEDANDLADVALL